MSASMICQPIGGDDRPSREFGSRRRRSVSPDSALFDLPLSDSSGDYEANGHNNHMMGNRSNGNASGIRIEDVTQKVATNF
jgi:hypothetical protein